MKGHLICFPDPTAFRITLVLTAASLCPAWTPNLLVGATAPAPTLGDVRYGPYERNVLDFWAAPSSSAAHPAPLVLFIHGGGWNKGDKTQVRTSPMVQECLDAGISFAATNYRFRNTASLPEALRDCARAVQFIRSHSVDWSIDPVRVASYGSSAGAGTSLWLAFHPDLADPKNSDPVLRQSSRPSCVGAISSQFSYDMVRWHELFSDALIQRYGLSHLEPSFLGLKTKEEVYGPAGAKIRADCDMIGLMSVGAPPLFITSSLPTLAVDNSTEFLHNPRHSKRLYDRARELGIPVIASIPALGISPPTNGPTTMIEFFVQQLKPQKGTN